MTASARYFHCSGRSALDYNVTGYGQLPPDPAEPMSHGDAMLLVAGRSASGHADELAFPDAVARDLEYRR